ncbi:MULTISPECIES: sugar diacid recognition domain-containing protein [Vibrio]|uniref:Helix-turn-helix domain-containing protein n=1 Tax=Vibrio ostreae TaxID=2841925 RepID=A0A975U6F0_9VIBR|nr:MULTISPECIES: sugar diacid recognition domain-containing protein [Vibrio]QXO15998.1 helix-turn-helix domain-containing protein [Vibrio ostreae]
MQLHEQLAQRIVDRAQKIIKYPLNVMDETGIIIASTNPARRYQKHGGAVLALTELKPIEISETMLPEFPNVKPGVNLPIVYNNAAIGVIGISGPLVEVRPFGEMVKMAAEMVVEYTSMMEMTRWSERKLEELLLECIDRSSSLEHITNMAAQLKVDIFNHHAMCVIEVDSSEAQKEVVKVLNNWSRKRLKAEYSYKSSVVLLNVSESEREDGKAIDDWQSIRSYLSESLKVPFQCSLGAVYSQPKELPFAFESAMAVMKCGQRLNPKQQFYPYHEYELPALFEGCLSHWQRNKLATHAQQLELHDPTLINTVLCWFENNCDIKKTSAKLYVHPNTLRYRIKRVEEICNINLHHYNDMCCLYFSLIL